MSDDFHKIQQKYITCIEALNGGAAKRITWEDVRKVIDDLSDGYPSMISFFDPDNKIGRGRIIENISDINTLKDIKYALPQYCNNFGRCNQPRKPVSYAARGINVILAELRPQIGDLVAVLHFSPTKRLYLKDIGALDKYIRIGEVPNEETKEIVSKYQKIDTIQYRILDAFFADVFSRPSSYNTFKISSAITDVFFSHFNYLSGIMYDSVANRGGKCVALKTDHFDQYIKPTELEIVKITSYLGYEIYDWKQIKFADTFEGDNICWQS